jgi:hypothetical protein
MTRVLLRQAASLYRRARARQPLALQTATRNAPSDPSDRPTRLAHTSVMRDDEREGEALSQYEVQRMRNIERNFAMLQHLGLVDQPLLPRTKQPKKISTCRKRYTLSKTRHDSLRARVVEHGAKPKQAVASSSAAHGAPTRTGTQGVMSSSTRHASIENAAPDEPQHDVKARKSNGGRPASTLARPSEGLHMALGKQGGWNASLTYEGTAEVEGRGISKRTIAIRKRPENGVLLPASNSPIFLSHRPLSYSI